MTKIGVGVGEDFPIEDRPDGQGGRTGSESGGAGQGEGQGASDPGPHEYDAAGDHRYAGCGYGGWDRQEWRAHRAEWRRHRREWKREHREWRRRFKAEMRERMRNGEFPRFFPFLFPLVPILIGLTVFAILVTGVVTIVASAPFVVIGLALLFVLYAAHRRRGDHYYDCRYYDATPTDSPPGNTPPAQGH